jgi:hypothetical protein
MSAPIWLEQLLGSVPGFASTLTVVDLCAYLGYTSAMGVFEKITSCVGFDWDEGNLVKNWEKHGVTAPESEQIFFNKPLVTGSDEKHSQKEARYYSLGQTDTGRRLFVVFMIRNNLIRVISARDMSRKERRVYDKS